MVVTDMVSANGCSSNTAMVLFKSADLANWASVVNIKTKYTDQQVFMNFHPRHSAVIPITAKEAERLLGRCESTDE